MSFQKVKGELFFEIDRRGTPLEDEEIERDLLNDDTFGEHAVRVSSPSSEFSFVPLPGAVLHHHHQNNELHDDPAIMFVHHREQSYGLDEEVEEELPPGLSDLSLASPNKERSFMTVEELEGRLTRSLRFHHEDRSFFPVTSLRNKLGERPFFPDEEDDHDRLIMTRYEREGISRIHLLQLTTEQPDKEDFYYQAMTRKKRHPVEAGEREKDQGPLYLPLPNLKKKANSKEAKTLEVTELGKVLGRRLASGGSRKPRQLLEHAPEKAEIKHKELRDAYGSAAKAERLLAAVYQFEDSLRAMEKEDQSNNEEDIEDALKAVEHELALEKPDQEAGTHYNYLLSSSKGRIALGRAIRTVGRIDLASRVLHKLLSLWEFLPRQGHTLVRSFTEKDQKHLINTVLAPLAPFIAKLPAGTLVELLRGQLFPPRGEVLVPLLVGSRPGLVLLCLLMSRLEILKGESEDHDLGQEASDVANSVYDQVAERLDQLVFPGSQDSKYDEDQEYYGWQFAALLAINVDSERKRMLVMELRDRIMTVISSSNANEDEGVLGNLNVFLGALGLDVNQLRHVADDNSVD